MMDGLKPYPEMKGSGVEWLDDVPAHWEIRQLKHLTKFLNGIAFKPSDWKDSGIPIIRIENLNGGDNFNYTDRTDLPCRMLIQTGDLVFAWSGNRGTSFGPFEWTHDFSGYLNQHIFKLEGYWLDRKYFFRLLRAVTKHVEDNAHGIIGLVHITKPVLGAIRVPVAPPDEQTAIARFLDHADRRIRRYIRAKEKLTTLLEEQKQAVIQQAVTGQIDVRTGQPYPAYKPSGVKWLGDVPAHWQIRRLRHILSEITIRNQTNLPLLSVVREQGVILRDVTNMDENHNFIPDDLSNYKVVKNGQFAMNKMKAWQGSYGVSRHNGIVSPAYYIFNVREVSGDYFNTAIRSKIYVPFFARASDGVRIGQWDLSQAQMREIPFVFPTVIEQIAIVRFLDEATTGIEQSIVHTRRQIDLLREYRTRLIADVVTGKLDVRDAAAQLPDEDDEEQLEEDAPFADDLDGNGHADGDGTEDTVMTNEMTA